MHDNIIDIFAAIMILLFVSGITMNLFNKIKYNTSLILIKYLVITYYRPIAMIISCRRTVKLVIRITLIPLGFQKIQYPDSVIIQQRGQKSLQNIEIGLVPKQMLDGPVKPNQFRHNVPPFSDLN